MRRGSDHTSTASPTALLWVAYTLQGLSGCSVMEREALALARVPVVLALAMATGAVLCMTLSSKGCQTEQPCNRLCP